MIDSYLSAPIELTDAELDAVAGGLVTVVDVIDIDRTNVSVAVPVAAAVAVLGGAAAGNFINNPQTASGPGRQR